MFRVTYWWILFLIEHILALQLHSSQSKIHSTTIYSSMNILTIVDSLNYEYLWKFLWFKLNIEQIFSLQKRG